MLTGELKSQVDKVWTRFWSGGMANPLEIIEQITYLLFLKRLDDLQTLAENKSRRLKKPIEQNFFPKGKEKLRWNNLKNLSPEEMFNIVDKEAFPFLQNLGNDESSYIKHMQGARFTIPTAKLLSDAIDLLDKIPMEERDTKGDLYEYLLSKLTTAGINGQFRTPRHIIRAMVDMMDPKATDRICDPSCGTAGFLSTTYAFMLEKYSSPEGTMSEMIAAEDGSEQEQIIYTGDLLAEHRQHVDNDMFHGFDFDATMLRIAAMNLVMHGIAEPDIHYQDTLSQNFIEQHPKTAKDGFDLILANPPFKGSLDEEDVAPELLRTVKTKKTELLFVALILRMLKVGGRAAVIVPDGVLFGSSKAHQQLRQTLIEDNQLEAIISLPSGVFKPYAGVSTAVMIFTKGGETDKVWFYDLQADGFSLDDKRAPLSGEGSNDLPHLISQWQEYSAKAIAGNSVNAWEDKTQKSFVVDKVDIASNKYDLSINRYKEVVYEEEQYVSPKVILKRVQKIQKDILSGLVKLEGML